MRPRVALTERASTSAAPQGGPGNRSPRELPSAHMRRQPLFSVPPLGRSAFCKWGGATTQMLGGRSRGRAADTSAAANSAACHDVLQLESSFASERLSSRIAGPSPRLCCSTTWGPSLCDVAPSSLRNEAHANFRDAGRNSPEARPTWPPPTCTSRWFDEAAFESSLLHGAMSANAAESDRTPRRADKTVPNRQRRWTRTNLPRSPAFGRDCASSFEFRRIR